MMRLPLKDGRTEAVDSSQQPRPITYSSSSRPSDVEDEHHDQPSSSPAEGQHDIESGVGDSHASQMEDDDLTEPQQGQYPRNKQLYTRSTAAAFRSSLPIYHRGVDKVIGLKDAPTLASARFRRQQFLRINHHHNNKIQAWIPSLQVRPHYLQKNNDDGREGNAGSSREITNPIFLFYLSMVAALKVMVCFLITAETVLTCVLTAGMIVYWHNYGLEHADGLRPWSGSGMEFVVLVFAVTTPIATAIGMAFTRREEALVMIADMRSSAHHLYIAHALWDWNEDGGRAGCKDFDFLEHCDAVLAQLVGIGDELSRFLTLPTTSRSRHRMTKAGRKEAARTVEVAYGLLESMLTQRMTRLSIYAERIKTVGLPAGEVSRLRQYERYLQASIERLRMYKMYRTPQALRSFARIFTLLLPPFFAPKFAQVAIDVHSFGMGLALGLITTVVITALFETLEVLEDPFVGYLALDGIDVKEEFEVLLWTSLVKRDEWYFPILPIILRAVELH